MLKRQVTKLLLFKRHAYIIKKDNTILVSKIDMMEKNIYHRSFYALCYLDIDFFCFISSDISLKYIQ